MTQPLHAAETDTTPPLFSVIIPTRDRVELLSQAVDSVLAQSLQAVEVVIVDDGSREPEKLDAACRRWPAHRVRVERLVARAKGHGPAYARNAGAARARGAWLCFLDDDDFWTDTDHLARAHRAILASVQPPDLYFTHQRAWFVDGRENTAPLWLAGVERVAAARPDAEGNRLVTADELLHAPGFAHVNCSIYRRGFYESLGGMDEALRYENDRDLYLRAIDEAQRIVYNPVVVSHHRIPDAQRQDNVSTAVNRINKRIYQLRICDKLILGARHDALRRYASRAKGHTLKGLAEDLVRSGQPRTALYYVREAMLVAFSFKWLGFFALTLLRAGVQRPRPAASLGAPGAAGASRGGV